MLNSRTVSRESGTLNFKNEKRFVKFEFSIYAIKSVHGLAPQYLAELYVPVADVMLRRKLRSATRGLYWIFLGTT